MLLRAVFQWRAVPLEALGVLGVSPVSPASVPFRAWAMETIFLDGESLFIAERCRPADGGDFQVSNYLALLLLRAGSLRWNRLRQLALSLI